MRTSDYNIYVPLPDTDRHILVHGYSGAVDVVDKEVAQFLQDFGNGRSCEGVPEQAIETLKQRGYLTEKTPEEERTFVQKLGRLLHNIQMKQTGFTFMPTYDCNLRCSYCYETRLRKNGQAWLKKTMDRSMVDAAYEAMLYFAQHTPGQGEVANKITLYGGEPFLKRNDDIVHYIVEEGIRRGYEFVAVTNAVDLDGFTDLLSRGKIDWLQITLDGPAPIHDKRRFRAGGGGSFAEIARNITMALECGVTVSVRTNVDKRNVEYIPELVDFYATQGWIDFPNFHAYCGVVFSGANTTGQGNLLTSYQLDQMMRESGQWHPQIHLLSVGMRSKNAFQRLLVSGRYPYLSPVFCGSQLGMYVFDSHGDVYVCMDFVGEPVGKVGSYYPDLIFDQEAIERWYTRTVMSIPECVACEYALLCGGGCAQQAYRATGGIQKPDCQEFMEYFRAVVPDAYKEYLSSVAVGASSS